MSVDAAGAEGSSRRKVRAPAAPVTRDTETMSRAAERQGPGEALPLTYAFPPSNHSDFRLTMSGCTGFRRRRLYPLRQCARCAMAKPHLLRPDLYAPDQGAGATFSGTNWSMPANTPLSARASHR